MRAGKLKRPTVLIVESLDRVSRDHILNSVGLLIEMLQNGVIIATVMDRSVIDGAAAPQELTWRLMGSFMVLARASEESETKSDRLKDAWSDKRDDGATKLLTKNVPAWLTTREIEWPSHRSGKWRKVVEDPTGSAVLRKIFDLRAAGTGYASIMQRLNSEGIRSFGRSGAWSTTYLRQLLSNRAAIGEFQPSLCNYDTGRRKKAVGEPIYGYYPQVIPLKLWERVQQVNFAQNQASPGLRTRAGKTTNLFAGLCRCVECGGPMTILRHSRNPERRYLRCQNRYVTKTCSAGGHYPYPPLEMAIVGTLTAGLLDPQTAPADDNRTDQALAELSAELERERARFSRLRDRFGDGEDDPDIEADMAGRRVRIAEIRKQIEALRESEQASKSAPLPSDLFETVKGKVIEALGGEGEAREAARAEVAAALRAIVTCIGFRRDGEVIVDVADGRYLLGFKDAELAWAGFDAGDRVVFTKGEPASDESVLALRRLVTKRVASRKGLKEMYRASGQLVAERIARPH